MDIIDFKFLESPIKDYLNKVDQFVIEQSREYDSLLFYLPDDKRSLFYKRIFNVVNNFLINDTENQELFIQIPANELGTSDDDQWQNMYFLEKVVSDALLIATKQALLPMVTFKSLEETNNNEFLFLNKAISNPRFNISPQNQLRKRLWKKIFNEKEQRDTLSEKFRDVKVFQYSDIKQIISEYHEDFYILKSLQDKLDELDSERKQTNTLKSIIKNIEEVAEKFSFLKKINHNKKYSKVLLIGHKGFENKWKKNFRDSPINSDYFHTTIDFKTDLLKTNINRIGEEYDIIVFIGDNKYLKYRDDTLSFLNRSNTDVLKKIIYIGTNFYSQGDNDVIIYPFSHREIYRYFYKDQYPTISLNKIDSSLRKNAFEVFKNYLKEDFEFQDSLIKNICSITFPRYLSWNSSEEERSIKNIQQKYIDYDISESESDDIIKSLNIFFSDLPNEKKDLLETIIKENPTYNIIKLPFKPKNDFIKREFKKINKINSPSLWLIDVLGDWHQYPLNLTKLLDAGITGDIRLLTYVSLPKINKFVENEIRIYNSDYRKETLESIPVPYKSLLSPKLENERVDLMSFYSDELTYNSKIQNKTRRTAYTLCTENEEIKNIFGEVIIQDKIENINDIYEETNNDKNDDEDNFNPLTITFYQKPINFKLLMELKYDFPKDGNVDYFSNLWKSVLNQYCKEKYNGNIDLMTKTEFNYLGNLKPYLNPNSERMFPSKIERLANHLNRLNLISIQERKNIQAANRVNRLNSQSGQELKDALFTYKLTGEKKDILNEIEKTAQRRHLDINTETILQDSLKTVVATNISKEVGSK